jgi:hypothetical protein
MPIQTASQAIANDQSQYGNGSICFRNMIQNGKFEVDQRNSGANTAFYKDGLNTNYSGPDRWATNNYNSSSSSAFYTLSTDAPTGFQKSMLTTVTTGAATASSNRRNVSQYLEGYVTSPLCWGQGASKAKYATMSFWVKSSIAGTYAFAVQNSDLNRSYVTTYTISATATWEYKTIVIPPCTDGTWLKDNGAGALLFWDLGQGSSICASSSGQLNSWQSSDLRGYTSAVKLMETTGATFQLSGVQLEAGNVATPFEHRPYGVELALLLRYYEKIQIQQFTAFRPNAAGGGNWQVGIPYTVKRTTPSITVNSATVDGGSVSFTGTEANLNSCRLYGGSTSGGYVAEFDAASVEINADL